MKDTVVIEYVWLDSVSNLRSKSRTVGKEYFVDILTPYLAEDGKIHNRVPNKYINVDLNKVNDIDFINKLEWSYDGSSTGQATGDDSEIIIRPVYIIPNHINKSLVANNAINYYIAMCDTWSPNGTPLTNNHYNKLIPIFKTIDHENLPIFGFEQEFFLMKADEYLPTKEDNLKPPGWSMSQTNTAPQSSQKYYCNNGVTNSFGRNFVEHVYDVGLQSGLTLSGINAEVAIGQWEIQVGPVKGIEACHQLWLLRFLLIRISEEYGYHVSFEPKPLENWNGSGLHTNYSDKTMRIKHDTPELQNGTYNYILEYVKHLRNTHSDAMKVYGKDNAKRMSGSCETSDWNTYSWGVADRGTSIRIPRNVYKNKYGYIEDRRPGANADPYLIYNILANSDRMVIL